MISEKQLTPKKDSKMWAFDNDLEAGFLVGHELKKNHS
jgi:hypothetical protein